MKIALVGKFGSGKNLFLEIAQKFFPDLDFREGKMAHGIYVLQSIIQNYLRLPGTKDGRLLQLLGSHYRDLDPDIWVNKYFETSCFDNEIITDIRFPNEFEKCKSEGYILVKINRKYELRANNQGNRDPDHISEVALDAIRDSEYNYIINNNNDIDFFESAVIAIIKQIERTK